MVVVLIGAATPFWIGRFDPSGFWVMVVMGVLVVAYGVAMVVEARAVTKEKEWFKALPFEVLDYDRALNAANVSSCRIVRASSS